MESAIIKNQTNQNNENENWVLLLESGCRVSDKGNIVDKDGKELSK